MTRGPLNLPSDLSTLVDLLSWRAHRTPERLAYRLLPEGTLDTIETITYAQLERQAKAIAVLLQDLNCQGQRVLLLYPAGLAYIAAFMGCLYAGAVAVPAYPPRPNRSMARLETIIQDATAKVALTDALTLRKLEKRFAESPSLKALYWLNTDHLQESLAGQWSPPVIGRDTLALLQYTSGSTAAPKGVMISHGNLLHNSALINQCFQDTEHSEGVSWLPPYHDMGLVGGILQPLYVGAVTTLMPPVAFLQRPLRWLEAISHFGASTSGGPNFAYDLCVLKTNPEQRQQLDLSKWTLAFSGAEPVQQETLEQFAQAFADCGFRWESFYPCYGMAETTLLVTGKPKQAPPTHLSLQAVDLKHNQVNLVIDAANVDADGPIRRLVSCGSPAIPNQVQIVNPQTTHPCPDATIGEIWLRPSPSIAQGYWGRAAETQANFSAYLSTGDQTSYLRTGDLGFLHQGHLYVTGRLKDLIIIRGRNYYPQDIEATVEKAHPALRPHGGAAFSVLVGGTEQLVIVQELERSALRQADPDEVFAAVRREIAQHHDLQVGVIILLKTNSLPKTSSGKVQRHLCRAGFLDGQLSTVYQWTAGRSPSSYPEMAGLVSGDFQASGLGAATEYKVSQPGDGRAHYADRQSEQRLQPLPVERVQSADRIQDWMKHWLAAALKTSVSAIDVRRPFAEYGLDSVTAVELAEALESAMGIALSPTLAYEYPNIEDLSRYLAAEQETLQSGTASPALLAEEDAEVDQLVRELEMLSDAEVQELLGRQGR